MHGAYRQPSGAGGARVKTVPTGGQLCGARVVGPTEDVPMSCTRPAGLPIVDAMTPAVLVPAGPVTRDEVARLCDDVRALLEATGAGTVVCDVVGIGPPGLGTIDALARMQLAARRAGGRIRLRDPDPALRALLGLVGLAFEVEGQAEEGEPAGGVEEAVESGDPAL